MIGNMALSPKALLRLSKYMKSVELFKIAIFAKVQNISKIHIQNSFRLPHPFPEFHHTKGENHKAEEHHRDGILEEIF
jgi:hypothetical protein